MIAEYGHFALILALVLALLQSLIPLAGASLGNRLWMASARPLVVGQTVMVAFSFGCLVSLFLHDDFSVRYVAANSNTLLPDHYKVSAVWGAHEGSLLLWVLILALWSFAVALFSQSLPRSLVARVLSVMGMISVGFYLFLLFTSNPFERNLPFSPMEGADLNPLLQDFGLIVHPPMLYMGYVGFSVAFAFAIAALLAGRMDAAWARWTRPWTNVAWMFLTLGIALGSWWAYYELGWGGWWFWDPVENASFMPWLVGTALVHTLAVTEKRGVFRSWTLLLAIFAFSLSLLGTFLVRSGVLTSVHAFAADPERGVFILIFLAIVVGGSLFLYALRGPAVKSAASFNGFSREMFLLINNILLVSAMVIILLGTLYPLIADVLDWGKISVGPPYFNLFFVPLMLMLAVLMAVGSVLRWKRNTVAELGRFLNLPLVLSLVGGGVFPLLYGETYSVMAALTVAVALWVAAITFRDLWQKAGHSRSRWYGLLRLKGSYYGMILAHLGVAVCIVGAGLTTIYREQRDVRMAPGERAEMAGYQFEFVEMRKVRGPNYIADQALVVVTRAGRPVDQLHPEKRRYLASGQTMTEAAIGNGFWRDLYVALGEPLAGDAWAVRIHIKPFVRWIWLGGLLIAIGGLIAVLDKRYRRQRVTDSLGEPLAANA
ncbi:MAG: heme lyase CcmF/NrfE family subunit [Gammaproteobacteria bacterium]|nr:MAG: heme lyase CcmF/NrfE family subunit [Gammaproteobacteria bacterium]